MATLMGLELLKTVPVGQGRNVPSPESSFGMEDLMAVVEINACFADGIQAVSGCTLGNNALVFRDLGKMAVTFALRGLGKGIRIRLKTNLREHVDKVQPDFFPLMEKVVRDRSAAATDMAAFREKGREAAFNLIRFPFETYFAAQIVVPDIPPWAPMVPGLVCPSCGEVVMATKTAAPSNRERICLTCAGSGIHQIDGRGIRLSE